MIKIDTESKLKYELYKINQSIVSKIWKNLNLTPPVDIFKILNSCNIYCVENKSLNVDAFLNKNCIEYNNEDYSFITLRFSILREFCRYLYNQLNIISQYKQNYLYKILYHFGVNDCAASLLVPNDKLLNLSFFEDTNKIADYFQVTPRIIKIRKNLLIEGEYFYDV